MLTPDAIVTYPAVPNVVSMLPSFTLAEALEPIARETEATNADAIAMPLIALSAVGLSMMKI
jgi:hypothetical protein